MKLIRFSMLATAMLVAACSNPVDPKPIKSLAGDAPAFIGEPATATPLDFAVPAHPFMAGQGVNAMHGDSYSSDVHQAAAEVATALATSQWPKNSQALF